MKALIDGDIVAYSCGFAAQKTVYSVQYESEEGVPIEVDCSDGHDANRVAKEVGGVVAKIVVAEKMVNALSNVNSLIERILNTTGADDYRVFLTGEDNFREELFPEYKKNRIPTKPVHYNSIIRFLLDRWKAEIIHGQEADDAMSIAQTEDTIICTRDKDLDMVPGLHYNWEKDIVYEIEPLEGTRNFYKQLIKGDSTDNIPGLFKLTNKRATKDMFATIDGIDQEKDMWEYVVSLYEGVDEETIIRNARLLWMRREEGETWEPPKAGGWEQDFKSIGDMI